MEKWFGRTFETFGDTDHDFLIKTRGSVKVQSGKQFIEIIKDGKLNVDVDLLFEVSSPNEIKSQGIYYCEGDKSIYVKIGQNLLKISDGTDSTYVSYITKQEVTSEQQLQAQNNIGLVFRTLAEAQSIVIDGFVYIIDEQTFYTVSKNNFSKLQFSIPDPYPKQFTIQRQDDKSGGALNLIGSGKNNGISFPSSNIYEFLGDLYIDSPTGKVVISEGGRDILGISTEGVTCAVNLKAQGSVTTSSVLSSGFTEGGSGFRLHYNQTTNKAILEVDQVIERDKNSINSAIRTYSEGTTVARVETEAVGGSPIFKVFISPYIEIKQGDFIEIQPYLRTQDETALKVPMQFYVQSLDNGVPNMKLYPNDSVLVYDRTENKITYQSEELGEIVAILEEGQTLEDIFTGASLYRVAQAGNPNDSSTWLETFCTDYLHNSISLQQNYTYNGEVHIKEHSIIGNIEEVLEEPHRPWKQGLYSDQSVLSGTVFRYPIDIADGEKGELINFPRYNSTLAAGLLDNYEEVEDDSDAERIIPTIGWIKKNGLKQPLKNINKAGLDETPTLDNSCIAYKDGAWKYVQETSYSDFTTYQTKVKNALLPVGSITMWCSASAPSGWLLCNGSTFSRTTYPDLYTALGNKNTVPDLRDRFIVGAGHDYSVGNTGGLKEVTLQSSQMPKHSHSVNDYYYIESYNASGDAISGKETVNSSFGPRVEHDTDNDELYYKTHNTEEAGESKAHENRPPYYALTFIIKAKSI